MPLHYILQLLFNSVFPKLLRIAEQDIFYIDKINLCIYYKQMCSSVQYTLCIDFA